MTYNGTETINASGNWWGVNTLTAILAKLNGTGASHIDFTPWLNNGTDLAPVTVGFQGDLSFLNVDDASPQSGATGRIQEAINDLADGSLTASSRIINVLNGLYTESNISVTKSGIIQGQSQTGVIVAPAITDPHIDDRFTSASNAFIVRASGVTITTLTVDGNGNVLLTGTDNFRNAVIADNTLGNFNNTVVDNIVATNIARRGVDLRVLSAHTTGAQVTNNTFTNVGNDLPGSGAAVAIFGGDTLIRGNHVSLSAAGIFSNAVFPAVPVLTIQGNTIVTTPFGMNLAALGGGSLIGGPNVGDENNIDTTGGASGDLAILVSFSQGTVTIQNNTVTGSAGDAAIWLFHDEIAPVVITGNHLTATNSSSAAVGQGTGIFLSDNPAPFGEGSTGGDLATITGNTISGFLHAIDVQRTGTNPPYSNGPQQITVTIGGALPSDNNVLTGPGTAGSTGIRVLNDIGSAPASFAFATIQGNNASISGFAIGIDVDGGTASVTGNSITRTARYPRQEWRRIDFRHEQLHHQPNDCFGHGLRHQYRATAGAH